MHTARAPSQDIFEYLRGEIHNKNSQINELQDKVAALEDDKEKLAVEHEKAQQEYAQK